MDGNFQKLFCVWKLLYQTISNINQYLTSSHSYMHSFFSNNTGQGCGGPSASPRNTGPEAGIHPEWDAISLLGAGTMLLHIYALAHIYGQVGIASLLTCMVLEGRRKSENLEKQEELHGQRENRYLNRYLILILHYLVNRCLISMDKLPSHFLAPLLFSSFLHILDHCCLAGLPVNSGPASSVLSHLLPPASSGKFSSAWMLALSFHSIYMFMKSWQNPSPSASPSLLHFLSPSLRELTARYLISALFPNNDFFKLCRLCNWVVCRLFCEVLWHLWTRS